MSQFFSQFFINIRSYANERQFFEHCEVANVGPRGSIDS